MEVNFYNEEPYSSPEQKLHIDEDSEDSSETGHLTL